MVKLFPGELGKPYGGFCAFYMKFFDLVGRQTTFYRDKRFFLTIVPPELFQRDSLLNLGEGYLGTLPVLLRSLVLYRLKKESG